MSINDISLEQEEHLEHIIDDFTDNYDEKYRVGAKEHGSNLFDIPALKLAKMNYEEAMDAVGYGVTTIDQIEKAIEVLKDEEKPALERIGQALRYLE